MKTRNLTSLIGTLLLAASANFMLVSECSAIEKVNSSSKNGITPETDSILAQNAANALRQLASARSDISKNNIPGAQAAIGKTLDITDRMKARFATMRLQELIAAARIRLTYQVPKKVLAYLELINPVFEDIREPSSLTEVKRALARAEGFLKNSDKDAADRELAALTDVLLYRTEGRPLALAERHLLTTASELDKKNTEGADRALAESENNLNILALGTYAPLSETQTSLRQGVRNYAMGGGTAASASLEQASHAIEHTLKDAELKGRNELKKLNGDIRALIAKSTQSGGKLASSIKALWERGDSLAERAMDYQNAAWEKFHSSDADAEDIIEAKLHIAYAEIYEFTTGETQKSATELDNAEAYLQKAAPRLSASEKTTMDMVNKDLRQVKAELGKNQSKQLERYATIRDSLSQMVH
jgi:hypothetical protein